MAKGSSIQALYELCKKTFTPSGAAASPTAIRKLSELLDTITSAEVGLENENLEDDRGHGFFGSNMSKTSSRAGRWAQPITYLHIYECDSFTIGIFCLPTSSVIPLHDHPGMTVLSKILYGSMHVKAYDWIEPPCTARHSKSDSFRGLLLTCAIFPKVTNRNIVPNADTSRSLCGMAAEARLAKSHTDTVLTAPCETTVLYPKSGGNLHCFTAISPCAVLDVLAPPYSEAAGRRCTYYQDYPYSSFGEKSPEVVENEEECAWLEAVDVPDNLVMRSGRYTGPAVQGPGSCTVT